MNQSTTQSIQKRMRIQNPKVSNCSRSQEFLNGCFTHSVPNATKRTIRDKFGAPNTVKTACPTLAKQQALLLDAVGPLASILKDASSGELTAKGTADAVQTALRLLGKPA